MVSTVFWVILVCIIGFFVFATLEMLPFAFFGMKTIKKIDPRAVEVIGHDDLGVPFEFPVGIAGLHVKIQPDLILVLQEARTLLHSKLAFSGALLGFFEVATMYVVLFFSSVNSNLVYFSLFFFPFIAFTKIGNRGFNADRIKFGEVYACLNQLFLGMFCTVSFVTAILVQSGRYFDIIP